MKLTNKHNLPEPILRAMLRDRQGYAETRGEADITVTQLLKPPRMTALEHVHRDEIEEDASDRFWALLGSAAHKIMEDAHSTGVTEKRFSHQINGWTVSGKSDWIAKEQKLVDYKVTSSWSVLNGPKPEWEQQLNMLSVLAWHNGHEVLSMENTVIFRDWHWLDAVKNPDRYPPRPIMVYTWKPWPRTVTMGMMHERVGLHKAAREAAIAKGELPLCTAEERWARDPAWAVQKPGQKRALKLFPNQSAAMAYMNAMVAEAFAKKKNSPPLEIVERPAASRRCEQYCAVALFCEQAQAILKSQTKESDEDTNPIPPDAA